MKQTLNHDFQRTHARIHLRTVGHSQGRGTGTTLSLNFGYFFFSAFQT